MFSLIITIISIALVAALAVATLYYGGNTLSQGRLGAQAAAYVTGAQQIAGASIMYITTEPAGATIYAVLDDSHPIRDDTNGAPYLNGIPSLPEGGNWTLVAGDSTATPATVNRVTALLDNVALCEQINKNVGFTTAEAAHVGQAEANDKPYACINSADGATANAATNGDYDADVTFQFRL